MSASCGFQVLDEFGNPVDGRVATYRIGLQIQIHGLGSMNTLNSLIRQINHDTSGIVSATNDKTVKVMFFQTFFNALIFIGILDFFDFYS